MPNPLPPVLPFRIKVHPESKYSGGLARQAKGHAVAPGKLHMCQALGDKELMFLLPRRSSLCDQGTRYRQIIPGPLHPRGRMRQEGIWGGEPRRETLIPTISSNPQVKDETSEAQGGQGGQGCPQGHSKETSPSAD